MSDIRHTRGRVGDRSFDLPSGRFTQMFRSDAVAGDDPVKWELAASCKVVDGEVRFVSVHLTAVQPLAPKDLRDIPWRQIATWTAESNAATTPEGRLLAREQIEAERRRRARYRARRRELDEMLEQGGAKRRSRNDDEKLDRVLALRAEAEAAGEPSYAAYVAARMGYSLNHVRKLAQQARERDAQ